MKNSSTVSSTVVIAARQDIPGPKGHLFLGSLPDIRRDRLGFMVDLVNYGPLAKFRAGPSSFIQVSSPEAVQHVLQANNKNYDKKVFNNIWATYTFGPNNSIYIGAYRGFLKFSSDKKQDVGL